MTSLDQITALAQQYADEQTAAALAAHTPRRTRYGCTVTKPLATIESAFGTPGIVRTYDNGRGITAALGYAKAAGWPQIPACLSWHSDPAATAAGDTDQEITAVAQQLGPRDVLAWFHEFDVRIVKGTLDPGVYAAAFDHVADVAHAAGARVAQIFTGWDIANRAQWVRAKADVIGVDPYARKTGTTALDVVQPCIDAIAQHTDAPVAVCETGTSVADPGERARFAASCAALNGTVEFVCWFNSSGPFNGGTDYSIDGNPAAAAAWRALCQLPT